MAHAARHDDMTGLLNRKQFLEDLKAAHRDAEEDVLLMIDADGFKQINDRLGHLKGDEALVSIAAAIRASVRPGDVVGRVEARSSRFSCGAWTWVKEPRSQSTSDSKSSEYPGRPPKIKLDLASASVSPPYKIIPPSFPQCSVTRIVVCTRQSIQAGTVLQRTTG